MEMINAVGRRKASSALVFLQKGSGTIRINKRELEDYFPMAYLRKTLMEPLVVTDTQGQFDIKVIVRGGGIKGQAEAIRLGIARALLKVNEDYRPLLKQKGLLTRDARIVERKKYGKPKARKSFQFSKR